VRIIAGEAGIVVFTGGYEVIAVFPREVVHSIVSFCPAVNV
jgi:hypothetical protein